ncbi:aminoglycoside phosphotransferase family protein [Sporosarcina sp. Marseille-Q4063]|uniref:aminoglycoside phosphotransferase family protein n=1 Tax=Sporosarcina sp. Marseille-Q4063 TaxID=2810514 RepID=UPI001BB00A6C|nr:aminoglycoside phosphotransferase family protein [Sporosarcina sp. Marseille-Q4063]QUW20316.1 aminoglycoside phosphotransferase family protein [Sporosarcina sp. Marseille-Q4063]
MDLNEKQKLWIELKLGVAVKSMRKLYGGASSLIFEVETEKGHVILRQFDNEEWLQEEPDLVSHESASLQISSRSDLPTPLLLAADETGEGSGMPSVLMTKVEGKVVLEPDDFHVWTDGLAKTLSEIHRIGAIGAKDFSWKYAPYMNVENLEIPEWTRKPDVWKSALERLHGAKPKYHETFIHRDFHPANVLWNGEKVSGIVDWPNACLGPAGIDVGHCRVNLALLHGVEIADLFLEAYCRHATEFIYDSYFDIASIFDAIDGPITVYKGWTDLGVVGLTDWMMETRLDDFMESVV